MATKLGVILADFTTSLATAIAIGGTTATLQSATDDDAVALPAGRYFFTLDGSNSNKEHISCDLSSTALTNIKSVSRQGVETAGVARAHRIGCTVALTDFAHIKFINDLVAGTTTLNASVPLGYDGTATISTANQLATKAYADGLAIAGAPDASTTVKGIVEEATQAEVLAKTAAGATSARLFVNPTTLASTLLSDYKADTGSANTYAITPAPAITAYTAGQIFTFLATNTNTGASTINVNALGTKNLFRNGAALGPGDIVANQIYMIEYDGTQFQVVSNISLQPAGAIQMYVGASAPSGWLLCDGTAVSRTTYATLFGIISTTYGAGDASTTFNVPDMRGRVPVGVGTGTGGASSGTGLPSGGSALTAVARAGWKGAETHTLTVPEMPAHTHTTDTDPSGIQSGGPANQGPAHGSTASGSTGGGGAHNNIQPVMGLNFIIKT